MQLTKTDITKFQKLYKEKFNLDIDYQEAYKKLSLLVRQMEIVYQPITKEQMEKITQEK